MNCILIQFIKVSSVTLVERRTMILRTFSSRRPFHALWIFTVSTSRGRPSTGLSVTTTLIEWLIRIKRACSSKCSSSTRMRIIRHHTTIWSTASYAITFPLTSTAMHTQRQIHLITFSIPQVTTASIPCRFVNVFLKTRDFFRCSTWFRVVVLVWSDCLPAGNWRRF